MHSTISTRECFVRYDGKFNANDDSSHRDLIVSRGKLISKVDADIIEISKLFYICLFQCPPKIVFFQLRCNIFFAASRNSGNIIM